MSKGSDKEDKDLVVTLLSNGSSNLFRNNSLTSFSNKLHTPIILDPLNYNYIALQEIGISLNSSNIRIPYEKPAIIYFEWDTTFRHHLQDLSDYETRKQVFIDTYEKNKNHFFINYPNKFGIYSNKGFIENKIYSPNTIAEELKKLDFFTREDFFQGKLDLTLFKEYLDEKSSIDGNAIPWWQRFEIKHYKSNSQKTLANQNKVLGLLIHKRLSEALKLETYVKEHLINHSSDFEIPDSIVIDSEPYFLYFIEENEVIRGNIYLDNKIESNENNVINVDCNIVDPYISNTNFCNTIATFNNVSSNQDFLYYYPNNRTFYKLLGNEIDTINIKISDKDYNQLDLFKGIPTIVKLVIKSKVEMDFTSNIRVSSKAPGMTHFYNKNSHFRVVLPSNDVFQTEKSQVSIASITYPNRFKVLPMYLKSNIIRKIYLYSDQEVILGEMDVFISQNEDNSDLMKDVSEDMSLDPLVLISNLNKRFKREEVTWKYNNGSQHISIKTGKHSYVLQIPISLGNLFGLEESDVVFVNSMTTNHTFKDTWFYKLCWTERFIDVMKTKNDLSIYELLGTNGFQTEKFFYIALSSYDEFHIKRPINLQMHRPRYALVYNNIIEDSIVDNSYYKILKTIYFEDSESKWKTLTYKNDEYKKVHEKTPLYLEFALRLPSGDLVEFENNDDDVVINLKTKTH